MGRRAAGLVSNGPDRAAVGGVGSGGWAVGSGQWAVGDWAEGEGMGPFCACATLGSPGPGPGPGRKSPETRQPRTAASHKPANYPRTRNPVTAQHPLHT